MTETEKREGYKKRKDKESKVKKEERYVTENSNPSGFYQADCRCFVVQTEVDKHYYKSGSESNPFANGFGQ